MRRSDLDFGRTAFGNHGGFRQEEKGEDKRKEGSVRGQVMIRTETSEGLNWASEEELGLSVI